ncbi:S-adenosylmethionine-dependent methyltransferase [Nocardioides luteus]|uniref:Methyltransferase n=1 Tax=Nocardioides luteus TaxID=1844 RepID=A0ABQ5T0M7_9ACTN|nr:methyltransferase domain-containing protein [Nocardioides luteus]MDR7310852.1 S-adenosylmethionine-dependent methyltransferase [Nocardioides luteus]GGR40211.1 methyltransferase [Nocardioides luteus]GLJ69368.1 methyltransferase [Nocardioides luteus]
MTDVFTNRLAQWRAYTETPWARIRYTVVEEILRRQCTDLGERLRILDVGGGDGMDALPLARAGHEVTILDPSEAWLAEAKRRAAEAGVPLSTIVGGVEELPPGEWDLVLCHFVLQYRPADAGDVRRLAAAVRPGGRLSVMVPNPASMVLRQLVTGGPEGALGELRADTKRTVTFDHNVRKIPMADLEADLEAAGLRLTGRFGTRIANDLLTDDAAKHDPAYFNHLLELERELCDQEPFVRVGGMYQLVAERPG